jgi:hypothetical protein
MRGSVRVAVVVMAAVGEVVSLDAFLEVCTTATTLYA